jgi:hypothetical protein
MVVLEPATYLAELQVDDAGEQKTSGTSRRKNVARKRLRTGLRSAARAKRCSDASLTAGPQMVALYRFREMIDSNPQYIKADLIQVAVTTRDFYEYTP